MHLVGGNIQASVKYKFDFFKIGILTIFAAYFFSIAFNYSKWSFLDNVNLIIHEAGHWIFGIFGNEFITVAGGTIMQILVSMAFVIYFHRTKQKFSAALVMFWLGQSILTASVYMNDAVEMKLPLLGGDEVIHDWNYLLGILGLRSSASSLAAATRGLGAIVILTATLSGLLDSRKDNWQF